MANVPIAREEFTNHLDHYLVPLITQGFNSMYLDAYELCKKHQRENETIKQFQIFLKRIPDWNSSILEKETERIKGECEFIMKIVTAIFTSYVQILSSIRLREKNSNIKIKIPMCDVFIHKIYINSAEQIFKEPKLFKINVSPDIRAKNKDRIKEIIEKAIDTAISSSLPLENILQEYIGNIYEDEEVENEAQESEEDESDDGASVYYEEKENEENDEEENDEEEIEADEESEEDEAPLLETGPSVKQQSSGFKFFNKDKIQQGENSFSRNRKLAKKLF